MNDLKRLMGVVAVMLALLLAGCREKEQPPRAQMTPGLVSAVTVVSRDVPIVYEYAGRIGAVKETQVRARVGGILLHRNFIEGEPVSEGDVLFELDPATYEAEVARQTALVAQAEAAYRQSVSDAKRAEELLRQKVQSAAQRDQAVALRDANEAALQQARAALQVAELNLDYSRVTAPISGITSRQAVPEGSLIASGGLLTTITQSHPAYVNFSYSDAEAREIEELLQIMRTRGEVLEHPGVRIRFGDGRVYERTGVIDFTSPTVDMLTGTVGVRAIIDNSQGHLVPGQFVRVQVTGVKLYAAMTIPERALMQDSSGSFVYVADAQNLIEKRAVTIRRQLENRDWWLDPVVEIEMKPKEMQGAQILAHRGEEEQSKQEMVQQDLAKTSEMKIIGLKEGETVITEGHFRIQAALAQMPPGARLPVMINNLDGQDMQPPALPDANGAGAPSAGSAVAAQAMSQPPSPRLQNAPDTVSGDTIQDTPQDIQLAE